MKKWIFLAFLVCICLSATAAYAETIERIVAIAGDEIITMQDLREEGKIRYATRGKDLSMIDDSPFREKMMMDLAKELVQSRLVAKEATKLQVPIGDHEVDMQLREMYRQSGQSEEDYKAYLEQSGMSWNMFRKFLKGELQAQYVLRSQLAGQVQVSEADAISCAQEKLPAGAENGVTASLSQILLREPAIDSSEGLHTQMASSFNAAWWNSVDQGRSIVARGLQAELTQDPGWFSNAVKKFSSGNSAERDGLLGEFAPGDLSQDFNSVFALKAGQFSDVISTEAGLHIIRINSVKEGESSAWKDKLEECRNELMQKETERLIQSWFNDLMEQNYVSFKLMDDISEEASNASEGR